MKKKTMTKINLGHTRVKDKSSEKTNHHVAIITRSTQKPAVEGRSKKLRLHFQVRNCFPSAFDKYVRLQHPIKNMSDLRLLQL